MLVGAPLMKEDLPPYEPPPAWIPLDKRRGHPDYDNDIYQYLPRSVTIKRTKATDTLGFNIRGGKNMGCGIFISKVLEGSEAHFSGLKEGDQILWVNDVNFEDVDHTEAVRVLKSSTDIRMTVRFFPFGYEITYERTKDVNLIQQQLRSNAADFDNRQETPGAYNMPPGGQMEEQFQTRPPQGYPDQFQDSQSRNQSQERSYSDYREANPQQSDYREATPQQSSFREATPQQSSFREATPQQSSFREATPQQSSFREATPQQSSFREATPQQSSFREAIPQQSSFREAIPQQNMGFQEGSTSINQEQRYPDPQTYPVNTRTPPGTQSPYQQFREMNQSHQLEPNPQYRQDRYDGSYPQRNERDWR